MLIDTHCHLDFEDFAADLGDILVRAKEAGVEQIITIGIEVSSSRQAISLAEANREVYATVGIHPHNACQLSFENIQELIALGGKSKVVAYGEIGLDFYRNYQPRSLQLSCLRDQISLARQLDLPLVVHNRDAHEEILQTLRDERAWEIGGVMHCFSGDAEYAKNLVGFGFYISFAGNITYPNFKKTDVIDSIPLERILIETDCPFLAPQQKRGQKNEPLNVRFVAEKIAQIKNLPLEEVERITSENACRLFKLN